MHTEEREPTGTRITPAGSEPDSGRYASQARGPGACRFPINKKTPERRGIFRGISGANERIRTADLLITSELLYQLSYIGLSCTGLRKYGWLHGLSSRVAYSDRPSLPSGRPSRQFHRSDRARFPLRIFGLSCYPIFRYTCHEGNLNHSSHPAGACKRP